MLFVTHTFVLMYFYFPNDQNIESVEQYIIERVIIKNDSHNSTDVFKLSFILQFLLMF